MVQEDNFLTLMMEADGWARTGDELELLRDGDVVVRFTLAVPIDLAGTSWSLLSYNDQAEALASTIIGTDVNLTFVDGTASGSAGCNNYNAQYEATEATLAFSPPVSTRMFCDTPAGVMEQEGLFLLDMEMVATYEVTADGNLNMFDGEGARLLQFTPSS
jgi:heat shock protein HslJ